MTTPEGLEPAPPPLPKTSGWAIASVILAACCIIPLLGLLLGLLGAIFGVVALIVISRSNGQRKGLPLAIVGLCLGIFGGVFVQGLIAAMAIPAFQKVRETSQEHAITNNLRQFASAAQQYMLDEGAAEVSHDDIVGPGKHISSLEPIAGESYRDLVVNLSTQSIAVTTAGGRVIEYRF